MNGNAQAGDIGWIVPKISRIESDLEEDEGNEDSRDDDNEDNTGGGVNLSRLEVREPFCARDTTFKP